MTSTSGIITVAIRRSASGLYAATSESLEGLYVAHRDAQTIIDDLPTIVKHWFEKHKDIAVEVFTGPVSTNDGDYVFPAIPVPIRPEIAAQA